MSAMLGALEHGRTKEVSVEDQLLVDVRTACHRLSIGRTRLYELLAAGELEAVHVGRSVRIPTDGLRTFVDKLRTGEARNEGDA